ncbi:hypothetical protein DB347_15475 [Opitutaceae bacterium EW11]|nr:hypothetical protein DB347_15475 [Opitutaceae bacterium EW11]
MTPQSESDDLLSEVLAETTSPGFRDEILRETVRCARCRRAMRTVRRAGLAAVALAFAAGLFWRWFDGKKPSLVAVPQPPYTLVLTQHLADSQTVRTVPLQAIIRTEPGANVVMIRTEPDQLSFRVINDDELLALAGSGAALVRVSPHEARLIRDSDSVGSSSRPL